MYPVGDTQWLYVICLVYFAVSTGATKQLLIVVYKYMLPIMLYVDACL